MEIRNRLKKRRGLMPPPFLAVNKALRASFLTAYPRLTGLFSFRHSLGGRPYLFLNAWEKCSWLG